MLAKADGETGSALLAGSVCGMSKLWKALVPGPKGWKGEMVSSDEKTDVPSWVWVVLTRRGLGRRAGALLSSLFEAMLNVYHVKTFLNSLTYAKESSYRYRGVELDGSSSYSDLLHGQFCGCLVTADDDKLERVGSETIIC